MVKRINTPSMLALCALLAGACTATIEERQFQCNLDEACPEGFHCFDGFCCTSIEACESGATDGGMDASADARIDSPDSGMDAQVPDASFDVGTDAYVEPDVPGCLAIAANIVDSSSSGGLVTLQLSATDTFAELAGDAAVDAGGIDVQSASFGSSRLTLSYRAPRSLVTLPPSGSEPISLTVTQGSACFQMTLPMPVTLALQVITPNDESTCTRCASQSVDVASGGTVVFSSTDDLDLDVLDETNRSDIFMQKPNEELVLLSERWNVASQYVRIADDGTAVVYSPGEGLVVSQLTSAPYAAEDINRNCVIGGANWCGPNFAPTEITTSPTRIGYLQMNSPSTGVGNLADSFARTGASGFVMRGHEFVDIRVNGTIWGLAQSGRVFRGVGRGTPGDVDFSTSADRAFFPGLTATEGVFQRGEAVVIVREEAVAFSFNDSTFLGASSDLARVLVVQDGSLFLIEDAGAGYEATAIQDQSSANMLTNLRLASVDNPAALSGDGEWIGVLLGSPTRVARIRVE